ncbi:MAG: DJ-1/PfpI family protein [Anaerolineae bacterium]|nr:DJ-1/PfpI family protein [Anaerolineae bacterium]
MNTLNVAVFIFDDVEVLDFAGPYEVFYTAARVALRLAPQDPPPFKVFTVSEQSKTVFARGSLPVQAHYNFSNHPAADVLIVPGGVVSAELEKITVIDWIKNQAAGAGLTASVCTGAFLLAKAGLLDGKEATTHWEDTADLQKMFPSLKVMEAVRWIDNGSLVTSAGISAGIDMSLHLVEKLCGRELALKTARQMDYAWQD